RVRHVDRDRLRAVADRLRGSAVATGQRRAEILLEDALERPQARPLHGVLDAVDDALVEPERDVVHAAGTRVAVAHDRPVRDALPPRAVVDAWVVVVRV